jgi:hypothetical protein
VPGGWTGGFGRVDRWVPGGWGGRRAAGLQVEEGWKGGDCGCCPRRAAEAALGREGFLPAALVQDAGRRPAAPHLVPARPAAPPTPPLRCNPPHPAPPWLQGRDPPHGRAGALLRADSARGAAGSSRRARTPRGAWRQARAGAGVQVGVWAPGAHSRAVLCSCDPSAIHSGVRLPHRPRTTPCRLILVSLAWDVLIVYLSLALLRGALYIFHYVLMQVGWRAWVSEGGGGSGSCDEHVVTQGCMTT